MRRRTFLQEFTGERESLAKFFKNKQEFDKGALLVPNGPGLGLEPTPALLDL